MSSAPARLPRSPFAMLGFWCGIAAWIAALLTPILLSLAFLLVFPLAFLAVGVGVIALFHIRRAPRAWGGKRWAFASICMGGFWLLFLVIALIANAA